MSAEQCPIPGSLKSRSGGWDLGTRAGIRSSRSPTALRNWMANIESGCGKDGRWTDVRKCRWAENLPQVRATGSLQLKETVEFKNYKNTITHLVIDKEINKPTLKMKKKTDSVTHTANISKTIQVVSVIHLVSVVPHFKIELDRWVFTDVVNIMKLKNHFYFSLGQQFEKPSSK